MATNREKQLATLLLKERIEHLTGKRVVLKETVSPPKDLKKAGEIAEQIRRILGISQEELAKLAGVSSSTVKRGEKGFEERTRENQEKIIRALYKKAGYDMPTIFKEDNSSFITLDEKFLFQFIRTYIPSLEDEKGFENYNTKDLEGLSETLQTIIYEPSYETGFVTKKEINQAKQSKDWGRFKEVAETLTSF